MTAGAVLFLVVGLGLVGVPFAVLTLGAGWGYRSARVIAVAWYEQSLLRPRLGIASVAAVLIIVVTALGFGRSMFHLLHRVGLRTHSDHTIRVVRVVLIALWALIGAGTAGLIVSQLLVWFVGGASMVRSVWASLFLREAIGPLDFWLTLLCGLLALLAGVPLAVYAWHRMATSLLGLTEPEVAALAGGGPSRWEHKDPSARP
jgi:hypothetical protein